MSIRTLGVVILGQCAWWSAATLGQTTQPTSQPAQAPEVQAPETEVPVRTTAELPEGVGATVNGKPILNSKIDEILLAVVEQRSGGRPLPPQVMAQARKNLTPQILEALIDDNLLDQDAEQAKITISEQELQAAAQAGLQLYLLRSGMTQGEFEDRLKIEQDVSLPEFLDQRAHDPQFKKFKLHAKLLEQRFPQEFNFSDEDIKKQYDTDLQMVYSKPQMVRASHILIPVTQNMSEDDRLSAQQKAAQVLTEVQAPGADFAALATQHSQCPSRSRGGDLGYFPREGAVVDSFATAAFEAQPGVIGEVVETPFGFHIIMVTGRKEANVITLAQAKEAIVDQLNAQKVAEIRERHTVALRKDATIVYAKSEPTDAPTPDETSAG